MDRGAEVDATHDDGPTALHNSVVQGHDNVSSLLLDKGATIDKAGKENGWTPLILAASLGRTATVRLLLQRGADKGKWDADGKNAIELAQESPFNTEEIKRMLRD